MLFPQINEKKTKETEVVILLECLAHLVCQAALDTASFFK